VAPPARYNGETSRTQLIIARPAAKLAPIIVSSGINVALGVGMDEIERRIVSKLTRRLVPLLIACYFVAILDRGNVAVAALTMNHDLGLSATAFGLAAGIVFLPYFLFELPSNLALQRFGARLWIARIMITWGIISGLNAFVWNANSYYVVRALLGAAEAGFFPGIIFYVTL